MNARVVQQALQIFEDLLDLDGDARAQAIQEACSEDELLRREVERLLANEKGIEIVEHDNLNQTFDDSNTVFVPQSIDRYELLEEIGRGGMGTVHRALDRQLDREVAIKVIRDSAIHGDALRRFSAEAKIASTLQHPGIAPVYDSGLLPDGRPFLAMKLVDGKTLTSMLADRSSPMDGQARLLAAFEDLCQVIAYAHSHDIIHRDLKPDNVMVGSFGEMQVMDWGLAKHLHEQELASTEPDSRESSPSPARRRSGSDTRLGTVMGTPAYMPPEQMAGIRGKQTDVFSLGAILCEILTGRPPYTADSADEVLHKSAKADLEEANRRLEQCGADAELVQLASQCLLADREQRPVDGAEVANRISAYTQTVQSRLRQAEMATARSETMAVEEKKRRRVRAMLFATASLLVIVLLSGWVWISHRETIRVRNEALRQAAVIVQIDRSKTEAIRLRQAAEDSAIDDFAAWKSAAVAVNQAQSLLDRSLPSELIEEVNALAAQIASQTSDRKLLAEIERARERSLQQVTVPGEPEPPLRQRRHEQLTGVFAATPLDLQSSDVAAARDFISAKDLSVREALIGAIDQWMIACDSSEDRQRLAETINAVDENPWRRDWREAAIGDDVLKLRALLDNDLTYEQSPRSILNLCWSVKELEPGVNTITTLERVYRSHADDYWLNCALGDQALQLGNSHLAAQHYRYALGMRPMSSLHREIGRVFLATGWLNHALQHLQQALELNDRSGMSWELIAVNYFRLGRLDDAGAAYQRANTLLSGELSQVMDYVNFLDYSGQKSAAIDYLRNQHADARGLSDSLHRRLVEMIYFDRRYMEAIDEFNRYTERQFVDPILHVHLAAAAVMAADGIGKGTRVSTDEQRSQLREQALDWLNSALSAWASRQTGEHVIREITVNRADGIFDSVFQPDAIAMLPPEQQLAWQEFWSKVAEEQRQLAAHDVANRNMANWTILEPQSISSEAGADFQRLDDGSFLVEGAREAVDVYTLATEVGVAGIHAIRLDVITDERLPSRGPGRHPTGNFHISEVELWVEDKSSDRELRQLLFDRAIATHSWQDRPIANAIDGDRHTIWHVWGKLGYSHTAKLYLNEPLTPQDGTRLTIRLVHGGDNVNATLGRFRISFQRAK